MAASVLWVDKYRPKTISEYIFTNPDVKDQFKQWISEGSIPNLIFSGGPGSGKTSAAQMILNEIKIPEFDIMFANGSKEGRKIEWVDKLIAFCQTIPFSNYKVVLVDEFDYSNPVSVMPAIRNLMEEYSEYVRFIFTCNYPNRIIPPLHSRCQTIRIEKVELIDFTEKVATILINEHIEFDLDTLDTYVKSTYPDLRKCINQLQLNSINGILKNTQSVTNSADYQLVMVDLFKKGKITEARKLLCDQAAPEEMEGIYTWCYKNIELFGKTEQQQDQAILILKQGLVDHTICADAELNLAATLVRLSRNFNEV